MKVFISYCHKDHDYVSRLIRQLSPITGKDKLFVRGEILPHLFC